LSIFKNDFCGNYEDFMHFFKYSGILFDQKHPNFSKDRRFVGKQVEKSFGEQKMRTQTPQFPSMFYSRLSRSIFGSKKGA
jgi:hypothetical protein